MIDWTLEDALPDAASMVWPEGVCIADLAARECSSIEESYVRSEKGLGALG